MSTSPILEVQYIESIPIDLLKHTEGSAGYDLYSAVDIVIPPRERRKIRTGIKIKLPFGTYGQILSRSSLASIGIDVKGGVIDSDYRGEIIVILANGSNDDYLVEIGQRIAQLVIIKIEHPVVKIVEELDETERGEGGFGSTGSF